MTLRAKLELLAGLIVLVLLGLGAHEWIAEREARIKAEATVTAQQAAQQTFAEQLKALSTQQAQFQADQANKLAAMQATFSKATTPSDIAALVAQVMGLKQTPVIITPPATPDNPHPVPVAEVPISEAPTVKAYVQQCQECGIKLQTATQQIAAGAQRESLLTQESASKDKEIAALQVAVKGGTTLQRVGKAAKWMLYGAAGAIVVTCGSGHCK